MPYEPNKENLTANTSKRAVYFYCDNNGIPVFRSKVVFKQKPEIVLYPFTVLRDVGPRAQKIHTLILRGWISPESVPKCFVRRGRIGLGNPDIRSLVRVIHHSFPGVTKLTVSKVDRSRFSAKGIVLNYEDLYSALQAVHREKNVYQERRKATARNALAALSRKIKPTQLELRRGMLRAFLELYRVSSGLSEQDIDAGLALMAHAPAERISVTDNYIKTRERVNVAQVEKVQERFKELLASKKDNEKEWQAFLEEHGWLLCNLFPFHVILRKREAYVGGKTIENKDGRVVDFLFANGFRDNYALLEIKTHITPLLKKKAYRDPTAFSMTEELSGAISQCVDQKSTFMTEMGREYRSLDPRVILLIGLKEGLSEAQAQCFELLRSNQKHVELVTFDELYAKLQGWLSMLRSKKVSKRRSQ